MAAADRLEENGQIRAQLWERLDVNGKFVIDRILVAIDQADVCAFDVTELNHNVMFELGYAIGRNRRVWLFRDDSDTVALREWKRVKVLTTVGYSKFTNSDQIVESFWTQQPHRADTTIFQSAVRDHLQPAGPPSLYYLPSLHETEAGRKLTRRVQLEQKKGLHCHVTDPSESSVEPLARYAQNVYSADVVVAHFSSPVRVGAAVHNARCALVSGLARGMDKHLLMLAEEDYTSPIDYRDLMFVYPSARECLAHADTWLERHLAGTYEKLRRRPAQSAATQLAVELRSLRLGDPTAENEAAELSDYFIETSSFNHVMERNTSVFVGRKGTGKTANFLQAAERLAEDRRNLVCVIKPFSYELEGLVSLLQRYTARAGQGYLVESLWKFLIYSEMANEAYKEIRRRPAPVPHDSEEQQFLDYMDVNSWLQEEFAVRLEKCVERVIGLGEDTASLTDQRTRISEALHSDTLLRLREYLGKVLTEKHRVAVLVDNLDKVWYRTADIEQLASFILGLLGSIGRIAKEFGRSDHWRQPVAVTLAVFLRSDIFEHVAKVAREPDKIPVTRLVWSDRDLLLRVVEARYLAAQPPGSDGAELWSKFFTPTVRGVPTADYILSRILPRPRDLIYFCSAAVEAAVNRRSPIVEEEDVLRAEAFYSQFALEALQVENGITVQELEQVLYEFAGAKSTLAPQEVAAHISRAGIVTNRVDDVVGHLHDLSFLGIEIGLGRFDFAYEFRPQAITNVLARRVLNATGSAPRLQIHPAFRSYLEISD